jgi:polyhydroxyalkanoate synthesis repressor PhaR
MTHSVLLKKYANRRLYDTEKSRYVTLSEVSDMIKGGKRVTVVDAKTREDVTDFILTQIILESAKQKNALLPTPLLHLVIRFGDNLLVEFFEKYLQQIIKNYLAYKSVFDEQFKRWLDLGMDMTDITQSSIPSFQSFKSMMEMFSYPETPVDGAEEKAADEDGKENEN